jgi:hypothetical protein
MDSVDWGGMDQDNLDMASGEDQVRIRFTDEEWAYLRYVRFGQLPPRIAPEDRVELQETDPGGGWTDPAALRRQEWTAYGG